MLAQLHHESHASSFANRLIAAQAGLLRQVRLGRFAQAGFQYKYGQYMPEFTQDSNLNFSELDFRVPEISVFSTRNHKF
ncbi:MAG: hypothetical protein Fur0046_10450 [Cyanobacteria bacterium J069]|nr:MAG: hypothetical protein D6742_06495 [Cyanobacteria bacterium J069]